MFRHVTGDVQEDRSKHCQAPKSCLTLVLSDSDNGSIPASRRRKSFCGLQLDGIFGAMVLPLYLNQTQIVAERSSVNRPGVTDQKTLPAMAGPCDWPGFLNHKPWTLNTNQAQSVCCGSLSSSVFTCTDWNRDSKRQSSAVLRKFSRIFPSGSSDRDCQLVKEPGILVD